MCFSLFIVVQSSLNTIRESKRANAGHAVWDGDGGQAAAIIEGIDTDTGNAVGDGDGCQAAATPEGTFADAGHAVRDNKVFYFLAVHIQMMSNVKRIGITIFRTFKSNLAPCCYICNMDGGHTGATIEGTFADAGYAVRDSDRGQAAAFTEGIFADACHAVRDGDGGQAAAILEGIVADAGHAVSLSIVGN